MTKDEIKIGGTYLAKVTDRVVPIRIDAENRHGGWDATNLVTNKQIRIKSAQRLRGPADKKSAKTEPAEPKIAKAVAKAQEQDAAANAHAVAPDSAPVKTPDKENKTARPKVAKQPKEPKADKGLSCLDAAAQVLKDAGEPMQCKAMIDAMFTAKLWSSDAPTPHATLYSAILREITTKGSESRFKKTERGHFALNA